MITITLTVTGSCVDSLWCAEWTVDGRGGVGGGHALAAMPCMCWNAGPGPEPGESGESGQPSQEVAP